VRDADRRQPEFCESQNASPGHAAFLAAPGQRASPVPDDPVAEAAERGVVQGDPVVVDVPLNHRAQPPPHLRDRSVQPSSQFGFHLFELALHTFARRPPQQLEPSFPRPPTAVGEAQEVEGLRLAPSVPPPSRGRTAAKAQKTGLFGVQLQTELRETLHDVRPEPPGFRLLLKAHHDVVSVADDDHIALCLPPPVPDPEVEHVVKVDVGEQW